MGNFLRRRENGLAFPPRGVPHAQTPCQSGVIRNRFFRKVKMEKTGSGQVTATQSLRRIELRSCDAESSQRSAERNRPIQSAHNQFLTSYFFDRLPAGVEGDHGTKPSTDYQSSTEYSVLATERRNNESGRPAHHIWHRYLPRILDVLLSELSAGLKLKEVLGLGRWQFWHRIGFHGRDFQPRLFGRRGR